MNELRKSIIDVIIEDDARKMILNRGYITYCLTNGENVYYNNPKEIIGNWEKEKPLYWSEVYCEPKYMTVMIRRGVLLCDATDFELSMLHEMSKINCN